MSGCQAPSADTRRHPPQGTICAPGHASVTRFRTRSASVSLSNGPSRTLHNSSRPSRMAASSPADSSSRSARSARPRSENAPTWTQKQSSVSGTDAAFFLGVCLWPTILIFTGATPSTSRPIFFGRRKREVDDPPLDKGTAVVDAYRHVSTGVAPTDLDHRAEGQRLVRRRHLVHVVDLTRSRSPPVVWLAVPGSHALLGPALLHRRRWRWCGSSYSQELLLGGHTTAEALKRRTPPPSPQF